MGKNLLLPDDFDAIERTHYFIDDFNGDSLNAIWTDDQSDSASDLITVAGSKLNFHVSASDNREQGIMMRLPVIGVNDTFVAKTRVSLEANFTAANGQLFFGLRPNAATLDDTLADSGTGVVPTGAAIGLVKSGASANLEMLGRITGTTVSTVSDTPIVGSSTPNVYDLAFKIQYTNSVGTVSYFARRVSPTSSVPASLLGSQALKAASGSPYDAFYTASLGALTSVTPMLVLYSKQHDGSAHVIYWDYVAWALTR